MPNSKTMKKFDAAFLFAEGEMFTAGLDLANVAPKVVENGVLQYPEGAIDPLNLIRRAFADKTNGRRRSRQMSNGRHRTSAGV